MVGAEERDQTREVFFRAWQAHRHNQPLQGIEKIIVQIVLRHPEYHALLEKPEVNRERDHFPEVGGINPFLHLGMHIAIEEQLALDQPPGIRECYQKLLRRLMDEHKVQHQIMECLGEMLWQSDRSVDTPPDSIYVNCLRRLAEG
ncbi:MAG: DUF1841 family protein [Gammaproteobacteria bacterium]|nr:DUF1841 family protein [Gammaproteobacteria bacterium]